MEVLDHILTNVYYSDKSNNVLFKVLFSRNYTKTTVMIFYLCGSVKKN